MVGTWVLLCPTDCAPLQGEGYYIGGHGKPLVLVFENGLKSISYKQAEKALKRHSVSKNALSLIQKLPKRGSGLKLGSAGKRRRGKPRTLKQRLERHRKLLPLVSD